MKTVQYTLLGVGVIATLVLPNYLLFLAPDALTNNPTLAEQYSAWSSGLVVLGPSFFTTSLLAMGSKLPWLARILIGLLAILLAIYIYVQLCRIGDEFFIPMVLGISGVIYCVVADICTPNSSDGAKISEAGVGPYPRSPVGSKGAVAEAKVDDESMGTVAKTEKPEASAVSDSLTPRSAASHVGILPTLVPLAVASVLAIVLDVRDLHASRNRRR